MTEILMRSDFAIKVSFYDIKGKAIALKKFRLSYSTPLSIPVIATFDGTTYSTNCTPTDNGVIIQFNNPALNVGQLRVVRELAIGSSTFSDGVRDIRQEELLPIQIVQSYSRNVPQNTQPTPITSPQDDLLCVENVILDAQIGPAFTYADLTPANKDELRQGMLKNDDKAKIQELAARGDFPWGAERYTRNYFFTANGDRREILELGVNGTLPTAPIGGKWIKIVGGNYNYAVIGIAGYVAVGEYNDITDANNCFRARIWGNYGIVLEFDPSLAGKAFTVLTKYLVP